MTDKLDIYAALSAVMGDVQNVSKSSRNQQQNFNFRGIDAVMNAVGPALRKHGVLVMPLAEDMNSESYETKSGTAMRNVTMRIRWRFYGPDGSFIDAVSFGEAADSGDKAVTKAHSVAYRTVLLQALCIPTDEPDPDSASHERSTPVRAPRPVPKTPIELVKDVAHAAGYDDNEFEQYVDVTYPNRKVDDLNKDELAAVYSYFQELWKTREQNKQQVLA